MSRQARKKRRQSRAGLKHGRSAFPRHTSRAGRTGNVHAKKTPPKKRTPYVGAPARPVVEAVRCAKCGALPGEIHCH